MGALQALPVIDVSAESAPARLDDAFRTIGFCYLSGAGVDTDAVFAASRRFHALSAGAKHAVAINEYHRGYMAPSSSLIRTSSVATATRPNLSESFMVLHQVDRDDEVYGEPLQGPNQWPAGLPAFREPVMAYFDAMTLLARRVTRLMAVALGLPASFLDVHFAQPTAWLRLLHYPPLPADAPADLYGSAPHTDYGCLTLLAQDATGGLEVRRRDGEWIAAPPVPGTFVVNVADMLARWTNDRWVSTPHRVRNTSGGDRYSVPFFFDMDMRSEVTCLPTCHDASQPARYPAVRYGDYVMERLDRNYAYRALVLQQHRQDGA